MFIASQVEKKISQDLVTAKHKSKLKKAKIHNILEITKRNAVKMKSTKNLQKSIRQEMVMCIYMTYLQNSANERWA